MSIRSWRTHSGLRNGFAFSLSDCKGQALPPGPQAVTRRLWRWGLGGGVASWGPAIKQGQSHPLRAKGPSGGELMPSGTRIVPDQTSSEGSL